MVKLNRFTRKTAGAVALTLAIVGGLSFNNFNTLLINAATTGTVTVSALNVRSGPSTNNDRINTISKGTKVTILATEGDWYQVEVGGQKGYVSAQYVSVGGQQTSDVSGDTGTVNVSALNVRAGAGTATQCIGLLKNGAKVSVLSSENGWYKIKSGSLTGYVYAEYITLGQSSGANSEGSQTADASGKSGTCNVSALNIRKGAGTSSAVSGLLKKGDKVEILSTEGEWYKISANGNTGYVFAEYITVGGASEGNSSSNNTAPDSQGKNGKCNVTALNVRSKATTSSSVIGSLSKNTVVEITGTEGEWYKIKATLNGRSVAGYVFAEYIDLTTEKPTGGAEDNKNDETVSNENNGKVGKCNTYALNVRKGAGTNYAVIGSIGQNTKVTIQETKGDWYKVKTTVGGKSITGYVSSQYITITGNASSDDKTDEKEEQKDTYKEVNETVWATYGVNVRKGPGTNYANIGSVVKNGSVTRIGIGSNGWSKVKYGNSTGYIFSEYLTTTNPNPGSSSTTGDAVVAFAKQFEGNPYVWGGNDLNTGVDCSGFTQQVFLNFGIQLNRTADAQRSNGRVISMSDIQPGDLVFYGSGGYASHVALYIGNGQVIHASTPATGIIISNVNYRTPMQINRVIE